MLMRTKIMPKVQIPKDGKELVLYLYAYSLLTVYGCCRWASIKILTGFRAVCEHTLSTRTENTRSRRSVGVKDPRRPISGMVFECTSNLKCCTPTKNLKMKGLWSLLRWNIRFQGCLFVKLVPFEIIFPQFVRVMRMTLCRGTSFLSHITENTWFL